MLHALLHSFFRLTLVKFYIVSSWRHNCTIRCECFQLIIFHSHLRHCDRHELTNNFKIYWCITYILFWFFDRVRQLGNILESKFNSSSMMNCRTLQWNTTLRICSYRAIITIYSYIFSHFPIMSYGKNTWQQFWIMIYDYFSYIYEKSWDYRYINRREMLRFEYIFD